jgi:hypothetical protein
MSKNLPFNGKGLYRHTVFIYQKGLLNAIVRRERRGVERNTFRTVMTSPTSKELVPTFVL